MSTTYAQHQTTAQKKDAPSASSVLDASSQSESLQRKADMAYSSIQRMHRRNRDGVQPPVPQPFVYMVRTGAPPRVLENYPILQLFEDSIRNGTVNRETILRSEKQSIFTDIGGIHCELTCHFQGNFIKVYADPQLGLGSRERAYYSINANHEIDFISPIQTEHRRG